MGFKKIIDRTHFFQAVKQRLYQSFIALQLVLPR